MKKHDIPLCISSEALSDFRVDFDTILAKTLLTMEQKDSDEAEITVKFSLRTYLTAIPDGTAVYPEATRSIKKPYISHKITSKLTLKSEKSGISVNGDVELVWDKQLSRYVLRPIENEQQTIFDYEYESPNDVDD